MVDEYRIGNALHWALEVRLMAQLEAESSYEEEVQLC